MSFESLRPLNILSKRHKSDRFCYEKIVDRVPRPRHVYLCRRRRRPASCAPRCFAALALYRKSVCGAIRGYSVCRGRRRAPPSAINATVRSRRRPFSRSFPAESGDVSGAPRGRLPGTAAIPSFGGNFELGVDGHAHSAKPP